MAGVSEEIKKLILEYLTKWKTTRVNKERLVELKEAIVKKTEMKSLPFTTLKKWIRSVVKETKQAEKLKAIALAEPIAAPLSKRVYMQAVMFDISAMRKIVDKTFDDLTRIKSMLDKKPKDFARTVVPEIAAARKTLESIERRIAEIERKLSKE
jgi:hypothetical protein